MNIPNENVSAANQVIRKFKYILLTVARYFITSTILSNKVSQWSEQRDYIAMSWGCGHFFATIFVLVNFLGQWSGGIMVIGRVKVSIACGILCFIAVLQTFTYNVLWDLEFWLRKLVFIGALLVVLAESRREVRSLIAGVPSLGDNKFNKFKNSLLLTGYILLAFIIFICIRYIFVVYYIKK